MPKTATIICRVKPEDRDALEAVARAEDVPISHLVRQAIRAFVAKARQTGVDRKAGGG